MKSKDRWQKTLESNDWEAISWEFIKTDIDLFHFQRALVVFVEDWAMWYLSPDIKISDIRKVRRVSSFTVLPREVHRLMERYIEPGSISTLGEAIREIERFIPIIERQIEVFKCHELKVSTEDLVAAFLRETKREYQFADTALLEAQLLKRMGREQFERFKQSVEAGLKIL